jgi:DNA-binding NarL/FixJ family response regulator
MRDFRDAKAMAQTLREALKTKSVSLTHSESLELVATILGFHDWNVLSATIQSQVQPVANPGSTIPATVRLAAENQLGMKILLVDDHALIRDALRGVLRETVKGATVLEAADFRQAMRLIEQHPDLYLILLDVAPDRDGFLALSEVRKRYPAISIVVLSGQPDRASVVRALDLGARGLIPKSLPREVMRSALQLVFAGGIYIPPEITTHGSRHTSPADLGLTVPELEVLKLMVQGKSNEEICRELGLSEPTLKKLLAAILKALKRFGQG